MASRIPLAEREALPQLGFAVQSAQALRYAAAPTIVLGLEVVSDLPVRSLTLNAQVRIEPARRRYDGTEEERLVELFGTRERWGDTVRSFLWTNATLLVPAFSERTEAKLHVACTYDMDVAAAKYFRALRDGDVPLELLFSGTVFYLAEGGLLRTAQVSWESEARFALPVRVWKEAIDNHFPNSAWLRIHREVFDRLVAYKAARGIPTWDATVEALLDDV